MELHCPTLPLDENFLFAFLRSSLPDQFLDKETIVSDLLHFRIPGTFDFLTPFVH